jgi:DNA-binding NarL/FixJ family response regulator
MPRVQVLLADDHPPLLAAIRRLLAEEFDIVGAATDGAEAVRMARLLEPDVLVIDLAMPRMGGIEAIRQIVAERPSMAIVALTVLADPQIPGRYGSHARYQSGPGRTNTGARTPSGSARTRRIAMAQIG